MLFLSVNPQVGMPSCEIRREVMERNEGRSNVGVGMFTSFVKQLASSVAKNKEDGKENFGKTAWHEEVKTTIRKL